MSTLFKGLAEAYRSKTSPNSTDADDSEVFFGQVLDVIKDGREIEGTTPEQAPYLIGAIRFNRATSKKKLESEVGNVAVPLDRSCYRLPMIGEQVLVARYLNTYFYFGVVTSLSNMTVNMDPNMFLDAFESAGGPAIAVDPDVERERFATRNDFDQGTVFTSSSLFSRVREGETILEGRMGGVIKLTHTITKEGVWDAEKQIVNLGQSADGDPMLIMKSNVRRKLLSDVGFVSNALEDDDVNEDASSFYLTTTQVVPLKLNSSVSMSSWAVELNKLDNKATADETATLQTLFPDKFDPNDIVGINVAGLNVSQGAGVGGGSGFTIEGGDWQTIAANFISKKEGFTAQASWDENAYRGGYGSDKILRNGVLEKVTATTVFTKEEAIATLADYSISAYADQIARDLGQANWDKLNNNQKAALTSLGYNVGKHFISARSYGEKIRAFIISGDLQKAGETIYTDGPKSGKESGFLPGLEKRRKEESQLFLTPA
jgi:GH24 family phage-related lysozyme (muramidase)